MLKIRPEKAELYLYQTFGLNVQSELLLPELVPANVNCAVGNNQVDVSIRFAKIWGLSKEANNSNRYICLTSEGILLFWRDVGVFLVRDGSEIIVEPAPGVEDSLLRLFILGTTLAMLLHQRGEVVVLHASVVAVSGQAVAFVGLKGQGKSTMAALLHARGHNVIADDILAADLRQGELLALPGFPCLKLWPDSLLALGYSPNSLSRLRPELEKRGKHLNAGFTREPVPLKHIFVLSQGTEPAIEPLFSREALSALMPHWYAARFGVKLLQGLGLSTHLLQCAELVRKVSVCRLKRPKDLSALPDVARLVEENLAHEA